MNEINVFSGAPVGETSVLASMPDHTIRSLQVMLGDMPPGDDPAAWWSSTHPEVIAAYERYRADAKAWADGMATLLEISGLPPNSRYRSLGADTLTGVLAPPNMGTPPRWWRKDTENVLIPRKRTRAEKASQVNRLFSNLRAIPRAVDYLPGLPDTLWTWNRAYPVHVRRSVVHSPDAAVCAFVGHNPDEADPPFVPDERWTRMKISTFHLLRERQAARAVTGEAGL